MLITELTCMPLKDVNTRTVLLGKFIHFTYNKREFP